MKKSLLVSSVIVIAAIALLGTYLLWTPFHGRLINIIGQYYWEKVLVSTGIQTYKTVEVDERFWIPPGYTGKPRHEGYVPDAATAVRIAEAVWFPIYGNKETLRERPYKVSYKDGVWHVSGTLPPFYKGGTANIFISKDDGKVLAVFHLK